MVKSVIQTPKYPTLSTFSSSKKAKNRYWASHRYHQHRDSERHEKFRSAIGATIGTAVPLVLFAKKQKVNMFKLNYGLKELIGVSSGAIIGGVLGGVINSDKKERKSKINEGIFQFFNAAVPPIAVTGFTKLAESTKSLNNIGGKIGAVVAGLATGMYVAVKGANLVCDPKDKVPDRKLTMKDSIANVDDALGTLAIAKIPFVDKLPISQTLPFIYALCGYRAGDSN